jgi:hypothetical protein
MAGTVLSLNPNSLALTPVQVGIFGLVMVQYSTLYCFKITALYIILMIFARGQVETFGLVMVP